VCTSTALALHVLPAERLRVECPAGALHCADHHALEVRDGRKRIISNVLPPSYR